MTGLAVFLGGLLIGDIMSKAKKAATVPASRDAAIGTLINEAGQAAQSMLTKCKEAAQKAAAQLDPAKPMGDRIAAVVSLYAADFTAAGHNVKALFVDALTLHAAAQCPVMVNTIGKDGKKVDTPTTAAEAVNMPKHAMKDAAKQVREVHGIGRKTGGGRKTTAAKTTPAAPAAPDMVKTETDKFSAWLDDFEGYFKDAVFHPRIVAHMITLGFSVNKAAKGKTVKGAASI
jgi:hypothetical protein